MAVSISVGIRGDKQSIQTRAEMENRVRKSLSDVVQNKLKGNFKIDARQLEKEISTQLVKTYRDALKTTTRSILTKVMSRTSASSGDAMRFKSRSSSEGTTSWSLSESMQQVWQDAQIRTADRRFTMMADNRRSKDSRTPHTRNATVTWPNLARRTLERKRKRGSVNATKFFVDHRDLLETLAKLPNGGFKTSVELVRVKRPPTRDIQGRFLAPNSAEADKRKQNYILTLDEVRVEILPTMPRSMMSFQGRWDATLGFEKGFLELSDGDILKLGNFGSNHRPLLQPIYSFYTQYAAPTAVARALYYTKVQRE